MRLDEFRIRPEDVNISMFENRPIYKSVILYMRKNGRSDEDIKLCISEFENSPTRELSLKIYNDIAKKFCEIIDGNK